MSLEVPVKNIMSKNPTAATVDMSVAEVLSKMRQNKIHEIPIVDEKGAVAGYVSYRTLAKRQSIPVHTKVEHVMMHPPVIHEDDVLSPVIEKMIVTGYRALPVVSNKNKLLGIVSVSDVIRHLENYEALKNVSVDDVMTTDVVYVEEKDEPLQALKSMKLLGELSLPVVDSSNKLVGFVHMDELSHVIWREKDRASFGEASGEKAVSSLLLKDIMTYAVSVSAGASVSDALHEMNEHNVSVVAVVDSDRKLLGIVSEKDIFELVIGKDEETGVFVQITGLELEDPEPYETIYTMTEKFLNRINRFETIKPRTLIFHVEEHHSDPVSFNYVVRARLNTLDKLFVARNKDTNMFRAIRDVLDDFERQILKAKEKSMDLRKPR